MVFIFIFNYGYPIRKFCATVYIEIYHMHTVTILSTSKFKKNVPALILVTMNEQQMKNFRNCGTNLSLDQ